MTDDKGGTIKTVKDVIPEAITSGTETSTIFCDGIYGLAIVNGAVRFNLYEDKLDVKQDAMKRRHVITLAMSNQNFISMVEHLNKMLTDMRERGVI